MHFFRHAPCYIHNFLYFLLASLKKHSGYKLFDFRMGKEVLFPLFSSALESRQFAFTGLCAIALLLRPFCQLLHEDVPAALNR